MTKECDWITPDTFSSRNIMQKYLSFSYLSAEPTYDYDSDDEAEFRKRYIQQVNHHETYSLFEQRDGQPTVPTI